MPRIACFLAVLAAALPVAAATKWDRKVEKAAEAVRAASARAPGAFGPDSLVKAAELLQRTHPQLAWQFATSAADRLTTDKNIPSHQQRSMSSRLTQVLMAIDAEKGERIARSLPDQRAAYEGLTAFWTNRDWNRAADVVREAWRKGIYIETFRHSARGLADSRPEQFAALIRELVTLVPPGKVDLEIADDLFGCIRAIIPKDPATARFALARLADLVSREDFNANGRLDRLERFRLGGKEIDTANSRETMLIPLGIHLHALDPEAYRERQQVFAKWDELIAPLKPEDTAKALEWIVGVTGMRGMAKLPPRAGAASPQGSRPGAPPKPPAFRDAFAQLMSATDARKGPELIVLLNRDDLTTAERIQAAREGLNTAPKLQPNARVRLAREVFRASAGGDVTALANPAAEELLRAVTDPKLSPFDWVDSFDALAADLRAGQIRLRTKNPALAARSALVDLRYVLDENYDFKLPAAGGGEHSLQAYRGKILMLNFWSTW